MMLRFPYKAFLKGVWDNCEEESRAHKGRARSVVLAVAAAAAAAHGLQSRLRSSAPWKSSCSSRPEYLINN